MKPHSKLLLLIVCFIAIIFSICGAGASHVTGRFSRTLPKEYKLVYPEKLSGKGKKHNLNHFYTRQHQHAHRSPGNQSLRYKITLDNTDKNIALQPNFNLVTHGAVLESRKRSHAKARRAIPESILHPLHEHHCHYHGHVEGETDSTAAISTCNGLAGYLILNGELYFIEPAHFTNNSHHTQHRQPHLLYKPDAVPTDFVIHKENNAEEFCGTKRTAHRNLMHHRGESQYSHVESSAHVKMSKEYFLEILVVVDKTMIAYHKDMNLEQYILTVFNIAYNMYHDASLGAHISLNIVRIIRLEEDEKEMNNAVVPIAADTLASFCAWQDTQNPLEESHPNHHDLAVFLTRVDLCETEGECGLLGLAYTGGACKRDGMCNVCEDNGLMLGFVVAHEIGHNLGMDHDSEEETGCPAELPDGSITVMSPYLSMDVKEWSSCSRTSLTKFLDEEQGKCMEDKPGTERYKISDILPGALYDGTYQCKQLFDKKAVACHNKFSCKRLTCEMTSVGCVDTDIVPAPGTPCGENKWCYHHECLTVGQRPGSVNGGWGSWSEWGQCTRSCGLGVTYSTRVCDNPTPAHGGQYCHGERKRYKICEEESCPHDHKTFIAEQCSAFNDETATWNPYLGYPGSFCALVCENQNQDLELLADTVIDGTPCLKGVNNICIAGKCIMIPCDEDLSSNSIADACGVCHGDGTSCKVVRGSKFFEAQSGALKEIVNVPVGATNIFVQEESPTDSKIIVKYKNKPVSLGDANGNFNIHDSGMTGWMGMITGGQETLSIKGPTTAPLGIYVLPEQEVTMTYSMGVKTSEKRHPSFSWDFAQWSPCSADCGAGTQIAHAQCMEKESGLVEVTHCKDMEKPEPNMRSCEIKTC